MNPWKAGELVTCVAPGTSLELEGGKVYVVAHCVGGMVTLMELPHRAFLLSAFASPPSPPPRVSAWMWLRNPAF
jgi:hypothetical protein